jgi:acetyl-CoA carboxylase beta subunit
MSKKCAYCNNYLYYDALQKSSKICEKCEERVKKLDQETIDWLMMVIDGRIEKELDSHTERYNHEPNNYGYY